MAHRTNVSQPSDECPNQGGRPVHPAIISCDAHVEALAAIKCDAEALDHIARAQVALAKLAHERADRLRTVVMPEIRAGYAAAEVIVQTRSRAA